MRNRFWITTVLLLLLGALYAFGFMNPFASTKTDQKVSTKNLLAISWQNAFCETHRNKRECRNVKPSAYSASHFTLHGLWPQPRSRVNCKGVRNFRLPDKLYRQLLVVMPAAKSGLHRHEWKKHGTCYGKSPEAYFKDAISLLEQVNSSVVRELFARNVGKIVTIDQVRFAFDKAFGRGSGRKVKMVCDHGLITELWINLEGKIDRGVSLSELMKNAPSVHGGCKRGRVDAVGFSR